jgi:hypothetical protein
MLVSLGCLIKPGLIIATGLIRPRRPPGQPKADRHLVRDHHASAARQFHGESVQLHRDRVCPVHQCNKVEGGLGPAPKAACVTSCVWSPWTCRRRPKRPGRAYMATSSASHDDEAGDCMVTVAGFNSVAASTAQRPCS